MNKWEVEKAVNQGREAWHNSGRIGNWH